MTREEFARLAGEGVILLDGATGSNLISRYAERNLHRTVGAGASPGAANCSGIMWRREARSCMRLPLRQTEAA